jgi:hypothetical protein
MVVGVLMYRFRDELSFLFIWSINLFYSLFSRFFFFFFFKNSNIGFKDFYKILEVPRNASQEDIKKVEQFDVVKKKIRPDLNFVFSRRTRRWR